jgi:hypothetical protein
MVLGQSQALAFHNDQILR